MCSSESRCERVLLPFLWSAALLRNAEQLGEGTGLLVSDAQRTAVLTLGEKMKGCACSAEQAGGAAHSRPGLE